eukprot:m.176191 g.176191  ORF g.176191 m.176191 type:complete len:458 (+) comp31842_c8_seq1:240-1613(+)
MASHDDDHDDDVDSLDELDFPVPQYSSDEFDDDDDIVHTMEQLKSLDANTDQHDWKLDLTQGVVVQLKFQVASTTDVTDACDKLVAQCHGLSLEDGSNILWLKHLIPSQCTFDDNDINTNNTNDNNNNTNSISADADADADNSDNENSINDTTKHGPYSRTAQCFVSFAVEHGSTIDIVRSNLERLSGVQDVEVIVQAPCPIPLEKYSLEELLVPSTESVQTETFLDSGMFIFKQAIAKPHITDLKQTIHDRIALVETTIARDHPSIVFGESLFAFAEVGSRGNQRFDIRLDGCVDARDIDGEFRPLVSRLLGCPSEKLNCQLSVVFSRGGAPHQDWHSDGAHVHGDAGWGSTPSQAYALCVFVPLIDLNRNVGFTQFWPASHRNKGLLGFGGASLLVNGQYDGIQECGDAIIYDYRLLHRGMPNTSSQQREILQFLYSDPSYTETKNWGTTKLLES